MKILLFFFLFDFINKLLYKNYLLRKKFHFLTSFVTKISFGNSRFFLFSSYSDSS